MVFVTCTGGSVGGWVGEVKVEATGGVWVMYRKRRGLVMGSSRNQNAALI